MNLAGRLSPSGPKVELQLPFFGASMPVTDAGIYYVDGTTLVAEGSDVEEMTAYLIPQRGTLGTFYLQNVVLGPDAVNVTYRVRRNGSPVGNAVIIGNNAVGPVRVDLSVVGVSPGNLISIQASLPAFGGSPPVPKIVATWFPMPG